MRFAELIFLSNTSAPVTTANVLLYTPFLFFFFSFLRNRKRGITEKRQAVFGTFGAALRSVGRLLFRTHGSNFLVTLPEEEVRSVAHYRGLTRQLVL